MMVTPFVAIFVYYYTLAADKHIKHIKILKHKNQA